MAMPHRIAIAGLLAAMALGTAIPAAAEGTYTLQFENDRIANTDRHYTTGMRLSWVSDSKRPGASPQWARDTLNFIYRQVNARVEGRIGLALGQNIFTPEDTAARNLVIGDRPYAGWLYGGISAHAEASSSFAGIALKTLDTIEIDIGVVGPLALGEQVQNNFHDLIGVNRSNGWDHQIENEPGILFIVERRWRPQPLGLGPRRCRHYPPYGGEPGQCDDPGQCRRHGSRGPETRRRLRPAPCAPHPVGPRRRRRRHRLRLVPVRRRRGAVRGAQHLP